MAKNKKENFNLITADIKTSKLAIVSSIFFSLVYLYWWFDFRHSGDIFLYTLLLIGEIYHVWQAIGYAITIWNLDKPKSVKISSYPSISIFITVCGEPVNVVKKTVIAAKKLKYPKNKFKVYILNDGLVANKKNYKQINAMAKKLGVTSITRTVAGGAKAGNINNALKVTNSELFAVFDADHVPKNNFLTETVGYFKNKKIAFVQTPQYYSNNKNKYLTQGAWEQQELFFGPIMRGKNNHKVAFWCGTNAVIRRSALKKVGGVPENNIAEDFLVSLYMHQKGYESVYVPKILAKGMAPHNLKEYSKQQYRWARGSLEIIFKHNPIFKKGLTFSKKMQYLYSSSYYLNGVIVLIDALIPIYVLTTNKIPVTDPAGSFLLVFFPFILSTIYLLVSSTNHLITFRAIQLSSGLFYIFIKATLSTIFGFKSEFKVTSKEDNEGNYLKFAIPHILYISVSTLLIIINLIKYGLNPNILNNASWLIFNSFLFAGFIRAAYPWSTLKKYSLKDFVLSLIPKIERSRVLIFNRIR